MPDQINSHPAFDAQWFRDNANTAADAVRDHFANSLQKHMQQFYAKAREANLTDDAARSEEVREALTELRHRGQALRKHLLEHIRSNFDPDAEQRAMQATISISFEELSLQRPESLDESIAITNVGNRGELLYEHQLWEIRQRMEWWSHQRHPRISDKSLAPYAICRAFFDAMRASNVDAKLRLTLFWQFDRYVLRHLHQTYEDVIEILDRHGFKPLRPQAQAKPDQPKSTQSPEQLAQSSAAAPQDSVDPQTLQMLQQLGQFAGGPAGQAGGAAAGFGASMGGGTATPGGSATTSTQGAPTNTTNSTNAAGGSMPAAPQPSGGGYSDQQLAQELSALLSGQSVAGWNPASARDMSARVSVVGRAFNQILADPNLARPVKPQFDSLRFSILKTALSDGRFFRDSSHPMRALLNELASLATTSRLYTPDEVQRLGHLLTNLHQQNTPSAGQVRDAQAEQQPVSDSELDAFLDELHDDQRTRRAALIEKSRRVVSEELWLQTAARQCSGKLRSTLEAAWEPMMALRLLRYGVDSKLWNRGIDLLKRVVDMADPPPDVSYGEQDRRDLLNEFAQELKSVGMLDERVTGLVQALKTELVPLKASSQRPAKRRTAALPDTITDLLEMALAPNSWFEIFDRDRDTVRWLQAQGLDDSGQRAHFSEFRGTADIHIPVATLLEDLQQGLSAAVNPTPRARAALDRLLHGR